MLLGATLRIYVLSDSPVHRIYVTHTETHTPLGSLGEYLKVWVLQGRETSNTAEPSILLLAPPSPPLASPLLSLPLSWAVSVLDTVPRAPSVLPPSVQSILKYDSLLRRNFDTSY